MKRIIILMFTITAGTVFYTSCQKELSEENVVLKVAHGSLWDSSGSCLYDSVHGTFYTGVVLSNDTNFIEVTLNVSQTGKYSIESDIRNGLQFHDSGFFENKGLNTIRLKSSGKPNVATSEIFTISFDSSFCTVTIQVKDSSANTSNNDTTSTDTTTTQNSKPDGAWQFTANGIHYAGSFDTAAFRTDLASGLRYLKLTGKTTATQDSTLQINIFFPGGTVKTGIYETQGPLNSSSGFKFFDENMLPVFYAVRDATSSSKVAVNVILYDDTSKIIEGLITGTANDAKGNVNVTIGGGAFEVNITQ